MLIFSQKAFNCEYYSLFCGGNRTTLNYLKLLRPKDWAKNLFLFLPLFFAGEIFNTAKIISVIPGFISFCLIASSIYILNDYKDINDDQKHPVKCKRPLASGAVSKTAALVILAILLAGGFLIAYLSKEKFLLVIAIYFFMNLGYSFGLKNIPILDIILVAIGFVLRVKGGSVLSGIPLTEWLNIMVFLLALFMAVGKRRDDVLLKIQSGQDLRKAVKGYNLEFLNVLIALICAVIVVAYFMYTMSDDVKKHYEQFDSNYRLYYTCIFMLAGIMRYLQIIFVNADSGSPTKILYKDRFIQITLILWAASFFFVLYIDKLPFNLK